MLLMLLLPLLLLFILLLLLLYVVLPLLRLLKHSSSVSFCDPLCYFIMLLFKNQGWFCFVSSMIDHFC